MIRLVTLHTLFFTIVTVLSMAMPSTCLANSFDDWFSGWFGDTDSCATFSDYLNYEMTPRHVLLTLGGGFSAIDKLSNSKNFPIQDKATDEFYSYNAQDKSNIKGLFNVFLGGEWWILYPNLSLQLGLTYAQAGSSIVKGTLLQGIDTQSADLYGYQYKVLTRQLLVESKLQYRLSEQSYYPYISIGLGSAFNRASEYATTVPPYITFTPQYADKTLTSFTYSLGFGVDVDVIDHVRLGIGYRFSDLGTAKLSGGVINTTQMSGTLSKSNIYANELFATLMLLT